METFFKSIGSVVVASGIWLGSLFGYHQPVIVDPIYPLIPNETLTVGATIPVVVAVFQTSLTNKILSTDTSMTLVNGTNKAGNPLSGYTCFNIDEGTSVEEFVCGTASSTSVTSLRRGIDPVDGYSEVTALKKAHGRGASVKITNFPQIAVVSRILNGNESVPNKLFYATTNTFSSSTELVSKAYVDGVAIAGAPDAATTVKGVTKLSTAPASSTNPIAVGDNDIRLTGKSGTILSSTNAPIDSLYTATTSSASKVVVSSSTGLIDTSFINVGTTSNKIVQLDSSSKLPAVDGSQLTNLLASGLLVSSTTDSSVVTNTTTETTIATTTIPAGTLGNGNAVRFQLTLNGSWSASGAFVTYRVKYGGTTIATFTYDPAAPVSQSATYLVQGVIQASSSVSLQESTTASFALGMTDPAAVSSYVVINRGSSSIDSSVAQNITVTAQWEAASASLSAYLSSILVERIK